MCNGKRDCPGGDDEEGCPEESATAVLAEVEETPEPRK